MFKAKTPIVIVVAMSRIDQGIGNQDSLLWHVPADLKRFKALTLGHPIIMGRKTFESILKILGKPLPGRTNIVITRNPEYKPEGALVANSLEEALSLAEKENPTEIHIGGGAEIYKLVLPSVDRLHVTYFDDKKEADVFFPEFLNEFSVVKEYEPETHKGLTYQWVDFERQV